MVTTIRHTPLCTTLLKVILRSIAIILLSNSAFAEKTIPELWGQRVHDEAHVLSQESVDKLEAKLKAFQDSTSNQIAVLIVQSLDGEILEEYSLKVAEHWQLGVKEKDNGVLLFIAIDDHKVRIETGQGLEGVLTDALSNRIIRNEIAPAFRKDDYDGGIQAATDAMMAAIGGEYTADENEAIYKDEMGGTERILIGLFIFGILGLFTFVGIVTPGCAGWFLYAFLIPFYALFPLVVVGTVSGFTLLGIYVIAYPILKLVLGRTRWGKNMNEKMAKSNGGRGTGWSSGTGWSAGGWSSGGGGGGGFSGGGGSFGGGGSSGSW